MAALDDPVRRQIADDSVFGRMVSAYDVETAALAILHKWMDTYLVHVEHLRGLALRHWVRPRAWRVSTEIERFPEDQLPAIIVNSPGSPDEDPFWRGDGMGQMRWDLDVACVVAARSTPNGYSTAMWIARDWAMAMRAILVQQVDESGVLDDMRLRGERYDVVDASGDRTICAAHVLCRAQVPGALYRYKGPLEPLVPPVDPEDPNPDPNPMWPTAEVVDVDIVKVPLEADVQNYEED